MSSVKLKHSSGNGTIINAPAANPSADITLKVPSTTGSAGQVLKVATANHSSTNAELEWAAAPAGKILQVLHNTKTDTWSSTAQQSWTEIGGVDQAGAGSVFGINITPSATSSKVLFRATIGVGFDQSHDFVAGRLIGGGSVLAQADAANNRLRAAGHCTAMATDDGHESLIQMEFLHSPNTTSETLYKVELYSWHANTMYVNRSYRDYNDIYDFRCVSSITAMEVGA